MTKHPIRVPCVVASLACVLAAGCASHEKASPYSPMTEGDRLTARAEKLTREAADKMDKDPAEAERLLRQALADDLYYGPAHNDLGVLCLKQGKLYEAAGEFEWARKLMPGHPDPRFNLALTLERAGRVDEALAMYDTALEVLPNHVATKQAVARLVAKSGRKDARTRALLEDIAMRGETEQWRDWARRTLALRREG